MIERLTDSLAFHGEALRLRAERQQVLAANVANADTPGYRARDFDFAAALASATGGGTTRGAVGRPMPLDPPAAGPAPLSAIVPRALSLAVRPSPAPGRLYAATAHPAYLPTDGAARGLPDMAWRTVDQASLDGNSVDLDRERAAFADNAVRYEAALRFVDGSARELLTAIRGD